MSVRASAPTLLAIAFFGVPAFGVTAMAAETPVAVRALADTPFERAWDVPLGSPVHLSWWNKALPETLYFQVETGNAVYALDTMTGLARWVSQPLPEPIKPALAPGASRFVYRKEGGVDLFEDRLWLVSQERLFSVDGGSGHVVWSWQLPFSPSTGFVGQGRGESLRVTAGDWEGRVRTVTYHETKSLPYHAWQWNLETSITGTPVISDSLIYTTDHEGRVSAYKQDREQVFTVDVGGAILGSPLLREKTLYVGNEDNILFALNRLSGDQLGHLVLDGAIRRAPFAYNGEADKVYVWIHSDDASKRGLQAVKAQPDRVPFVDRHGRSATLPDDRNPAPQDVVRMSRDWFVAGVTAVVASTPEHLLVKREGSDLVHALNRRKGTIDWSWNPAEQFASVNKDPSRVSLTEYIDPTDQVRSMFVSDTAGNIVSYRVQGFKPSEQKKAVEDRVAELLRERKAADAAAGAAGTKAP